MCGSWSREDKLTRPQIHTDNGLQRLHYQRTHQRRPPGPGPWYTGTSRTHIHHPSLLPACALRSSFNIYQHHLLVLHLALVLPFTIINLIPTSATSVCSTIRLVIQCSVTISTYSSISTNYLLHGLFSSPLAVASLPVDNIRISNYEYCCPPL